VVEASLVADTRPHDMNVDGYKREILREQYEQYLAKAKQARADDDLSTAAKAFRAAAQRLRKLDESDPKRDYADRIEKLQRAATMAEDGQDPVAAGRDVDTSDEESGRLGDEHRPDDRASSGRDHDGRGGSSDDDLQARVESFISETDVTWDDIGGLDSVKQQLKRAIALGAVSDTPDAVAAPDRVLLFGPPGTGKTLLASAVAGSMDATFFDVKLGGLLSKYFGESSKQITALFDLAAELSPSVIFLDEIDALTQSRDSSGDETSRRVLNTLLSELDGIDKTGDDFVLVLGATNTPWDLDLAIRRRFARRILVPLPDHDAASEIVRIHTTRGGVEFDPSARSAAYCPAGVAEPSEFGSSAEAVGYACVKRGYTGSDVEAVCRVAINEMIERANPDLVSVADRGLEGVRSYDLQIEPVSPTDVRTAFAETSASLPDENIERFAEWNEQYGTGGN
jgi:SpoVK/Ycf46/Vps4 family AAA+-type ATPase